MLADPRGRRPVQAPLETAVRAISGEAAHVAGAGGRIEVALEVQPFEHVPDPVTP